MGKFSERFLKFSSIFKILSIFSYFALLLSYLSPFIHPKTITILPFIGLAYPVILIVNIIWLFLWSIVRSKWAIYSLLVLLMGGKLHFRTFSFSMSGDEKQKNELKILSYNVQLFGVYKPSLKSSLETRNKIFTFLRKENPDVICLQEYYRKDKPTRFETLDSLYSIVGSENYHERSAYKKVGNSSVDLAEHLNEIDNIDSRFENKMNSILNKIDAEYNKIKTALNSYTYTFLEGSGCNSCEGGGRDNASYIAFKHSSKKTILLKVC